MHVDMQPPVVQQMEQHFMNEISRADGIITQLKQTSPVVTALMRRLRGDVNEYDRSVVQNQLRHEFEAGLYQGGVPPGMVPGLATLWARSTVADIHFVVVAHGDSLVVYFLCRTVKALFRLGQMITSGLMHSVFAVVIECQSRTTVDVYVRADDFNLRLLCLSSPQQKGLLFDPQLLILKLWNELLT